MKSVNDKAAEMTLRLLARNAALMAALVDLIEACDGSEYDDWATDRAVENAKLIITLNDDTAPDAKDAAT